MNISESYTSSGIKDIIRLSPAETSFSVGVHIIISATATVNVEYTPDKPDMEVNTPPGGTYDNWGSVAWEDDPALTGITATTSVHVDTPIEALRVNITSYTSGTVKIVVVQGDKG